jgi:hypothetical protein
MKFLVKFGPVNQAAILKLERSILLHDLNASCAMIYMCFFTNRGKGIANMCGPRNASSLFFYPSGGVKTSIPRLGSIMAMDL